MFKVGGYVVYRAEGVCVISDIREESFGAIGSKENYYILSPVNDPKSTVYVPVNNERLCSMMRKLLSADEIMELCASVKSERMEWLPDSRGRNNLYREILSIGDRQALIILINTVNEYMNECVAKGKRPTGADENAIRRAKKMLFDEFSQTTNIASEEDIIPLLNGDITISNK